MLLSQYTVRTGKLVQREAEVEGKQVAIITTLHFVPEPTLRVGIRGCWFGGRPAGISIGFTLRSLHTYATVVYTDGAAKLAI